MTLYVAYLFAYLVNSAWQAALLFAAAWLACRLGQHWKPETKHKVWTFTFLAQIFLPAVSLLPMSITAQLRGVLLTLLGLGDRSPQETVQVILGEAHPLHSAGTLHGIVTALAALYVASVILFACRLLYQLWRIRTLRHNSRPAPLTQASQSRWQAVRRQFQQPHADLRLSTEISGPVTIGITRKTLLLPSRFLSVSDGELDAAFAHELAHMSRNDYARNLAYELLFLFAAYHPCVRLARAWLAETREMVCDGIAARALDGAEPYAHALLRLASVCLSNQLAVPPQAIGIFDANTLERRLMSLKARMPHASWKQRLAAASACIVLFGTASASALAFRLTVLTPVPQSGQTAATNSVRIPSGVMAGQTISTVQPVYPEAARQARIMGSVVLAAVIGADGRIDRLTVVSGPPELQRSALDAVRQWVYQPYLVNGSPVEVETTINVNYQLAE